MKIPHGHNSRHENSQSLLEALKQVHRTPLASDVISPESTRSRAPRLGNRKAAAKKPIGTSLSKMRLAFGTDFSSLDPTGPAASIASETDVKT